MPEVVAVYEHGLLRPLVPLPLREQQRVRIQILSESSIDKAEEAIQKLINAGILTPPSRSPNVEVISQTERRQLADTLAKAAKQTLSEMVIEERGQW